jgi:hypothetical protein
LIVNCYNLSLRSKGAKILLDFITYKGLKLNLYPLNLVLVKDGSYDLWGVSIRQRINQNS